ncbi:MAG: S-layer homology domain-containing protein [Schwartzia sp.]|nr:S-layer homology domain-containing protein [Schwartzia sp. (in: firmicutes)]
MKKTLVSALTTALVVGAASTTFAAANPFEDVPADHWAYDAVAQLAADGVIEGYGDGTYRGDQEITRYEMAQMVARAMAKNNVSGADKAMIDKLAAEFADELKNLGVRVAALEKKVDNVIWKGKVRYRYISRSENNTSGHNQKVNGLLFRLEPQATINKHWVGKARIDYNSNTEMNDAANINSVTVDRIYVEGTYGDTKIYLGKFPNKTQADYGMILDDRMAGGKVVFGKDVKVSLAAARYNMTNYGAFTHGGNGEGNGMPGSYRGNRTNTASYLGFEVYNDRAKKFTWGLGYHHLRNKAQFNDVVTGIGKNNINIFDIGLGYKFDKNLNLTAAYAQASGAKGEFDESKYKRSYAFQLNYKGAKASKVNSWGAFLAYRHLGDFSTIHPTAKEFGPMNGGEKGWEIGLSWTPFKNVLGKVQYFAGKEIYSSNKVRAVWTELNFNF